MTRLLSRVVLDTNVLVAAVRSDRGASRVLLRGALERKFLLLVSVPLMIEYESVLTRSEHLDAAGLTTDDVEGILDAVALVGEPIRLAFRWRPVLPDAADDMVLETAVNGRADSLVTLNLGDFEAVSMFGIELLSPAKALERLETDR
jgi:putative PIN family toxin of toxin-antitoxin system